MRRRMTGLVLVVMLCVLVAPVCRPTPASAATVPWNVEQYTPVYAERVLNRSYQILFGRGPGGAGRGERDRRHRNTPDAAWFAANLMASSQYRLGLGALNDRQFTIAALTNLTGSAPVPDEVTWWSTALAGRAVSRSAMVGWLVENRYTIKLKAPNRPVVGCARYAKGGLVPVCSKGSIGHQRDVDILQVPGTNIYVNRAWFSRLASLVADARSAGFDLQATRDADVPSWMFSPGSWRSYDEQNWLYTNGYPANPPGVSMHEWGLAVDLDCGDHYITDDVPCWNWVVAHAPAHGVRIFHTATLITSKEAWHFSSNGI